MSLHKFYRRIIFRERADSETYISFLRKAGIRIGKECTIYEPHNTCIDCTRPWMIEIGNQVKITRGVTILTHDYGWSVLNGKYGDVLGSAGKVTIGNNVFIGMQTTILKNVTIGDNCIIGANSLVSSAIPNDCVVVGNPAKIIMSIEEYRKKRLEHQLDEAKQLALEWLKVFGKEPPKEVFREFFWLFDEKCKDGKFVNPCFEEIMHLNGNFQKAFNTYSTSKRNFKNYGEFLKWCYNK